MTRLSHRGRTEPIETSLCETQITHCWTWFILTLQRISWDPRQKKNPLLTRCGSFKPRIPINTIFTLYIQMGHWRNKQLGIQKKIKRGGDQYPVIFTTISSTFVLNMVICRVAYALVSFSDYLYNKRSLCAIGRSFPEAVTDVLESLGFSELLSTVQQPVCWHPQVHNVREFSNLSLFLPLR